MRKEKSKRSFNQETLLFKGVWIMTSNKNFGWDTKSIVYFRHPLLKNLIKKP